MFLQSSAIESILAPCSDTAPAGVDLRVNRGSFRPLRNQYNVARTSFRQLMQEPDPLERENLFKLNQQNWETMSAQLIDVLSSKSKDLEFLAWLCESQLFGGTPWQSLKAALELLIQVINLYWGDCHPGAVMSAASDEADNDETERQPDIPRRMTVLKTLFGEGGDTGLLVLPARMAPLIGSTTLADFLAAERKGETESFRTGLSSTIAQNADELRDGMRTFFAMQHLITALETKLQELCGGQWSAGSLQPFMDLLSTFVRCLDFTCGQQLDDWPRDEPEPVAPEADSAAHMAELSASEQPALSAGETAPSREVFDVEAPAPWVSVAQNPDSTYSRADAYRDLQQLAEYFRRTEPHSPVVCLLDRAVTWGQMSVSELMKELLAGHSHALERVDDLTGLLRAPPAGRADAFRPAGSAQPVIPSATVQQQSSPRSQPQQTSVVPPVWQGGMDIDDSPAQQESPHQQSPGSAPDESESAGNAGVSNQQLI